MSLMYLLRTRFKEEIVAEFLPPARKSNKVIIFLSGMPGMPRSEKLAEFFSKKGYWFFHPRYRGSWESGGKFLARSPDKDVLDVIGGLSKGFTSLWDGKKYRVKAPEIYLIGVSFGGAAVILASRDRRVKKVIALSPVIDWRSQSKSEPLDAHMRLTKAAFGEAYRLAPGAVKKLKIGKFYNPITRAKELDGKKISIIHAKDDKVVPLGPAKKFAEETGAKLLLLEKGGHLSSSILTKQAYYKRLKAFFEGDWG